ncbi:MAG: hypothetical protein ACEQSL_07440, partial [Sediminibacterium sp.]
MAFITKSNSNKIIRKIDFSTDQTFLGSIYKKPIDFFSSKEKNQILGYKELVQHPEQFIDSIYQKLTKKDNSDLIFDGGNPAYHNDSNCERIKSDYINFKIPEEIILRGEDIKREFRSWFKDNLALLNSDKELFQYHLQMKFGLTEIINPIEMKNGGVDFQENLNLEELESRIEQYLKDSDDLYNSSDSEMKLIIDKFKQKTWLAYSKSPVFGNSTRYSDDELKMFMRQYDTKFKKPVYELLQHYYRVLYNPDLKFEGQ